MQMGGDGMNEAQRIMKEVFATHPDLSDTDALWADAFSHLHSNAVYHLLEEVMPDKEERELRVAQWMLRIAKTVAALRKQQEE
jgi:hypothetical protein